MITDEMVERAYTAILGRVNNKQTMRIALEAALSAALSVETRVKPLEWSQVSPPNENCSYDHTSASAAWTYQIEWKSWKDYPGYVIYRDGGYVDNEDTLGAAKAAAQADYEARILSALSVEQPAPQQLSGGSFIQSLSPNQLRIHEALCDSQYIAGLKAGWNAGCIQDPAEAQAKFVALIKSREGHLEGYAKARAALATEGKDNG